MYNIKPTKSIYEKLKPNLSNQFYIPKSEPIIKSVERKAEKIKYDNSLEDIYNIAHLQKDLNKLEFKDFEQKPLKEDGFFGSKTKAAYDKMVTPNFQTYDNVEKIRAKNRNLVKQGLGYEFQVKKPEYKNTMEDRYKIAYYQRDLNSAGFTDYEDKPLKEDGIYGKKTRGAVNSYIWEDNNNGMQLLSAKAQKKPNWNPNANKRKGSENRQPSGDRERNVGHPDGEEHSRTPKGSTKPNNVKRFEIDQSTAEAALKIAGSAAAGYAIYRGVRMLPSLLPPLWWTLPANLLVA